jgi:hypothetical protein
MTKQEAHEILNRIRDGEPMSIFVTNQALATTGDIFGLFGKSLRSYGHEQSHNRPRKAHDPFAEIGFSYSKYLDCGKTEGVTQ